MDTFLAEKNMGFSWDPGHHGEVRDRPGRGGGVALRAVGMLGASDTLVEETSSRQGRAGGHGRGQGRAKAW